MQRGSENKKRHGPRIGEQADQKQNTDQGRTMEYKLKRLNRELASRGKVLEFYRDTMELPDGK